MKRREFLATSIGVVGTSVAAACGYKPTNTASGVNASAVAPAIVQPLFGISLAEWSLHRTIRKGEMNHLDFAGTARSKFGIDAVEYVNQFFFDRATDKSYLTEMKKRADGEGVHSLLIMCDNEGNLGSNDEKKRQTAVENHYKWVEAAKYLGCHSVRVNTLVNAEALPYDEQLKYSAMGLRALTEFADPHGLNVIVENHGSLSSNGAWLAAVMKEVDHPRCGTLPDFGNFCLEGSSDPNGVCDDAYDRYKGVEVLMPFAKAVSAKSHDFNEAGNEPHTDYDRMMRIVLDAGYRGFVGIEYEGDKLSEPDGIQATKVLLERVRDALADEYNKS